MASCECGREWTGMSEAHCAAPGCHESFSTVANFDAHRVFREDGDWNTRGCLNSAEIDSLRSKSGRKLFDRSPRKAGYVWVGAGSNPHGEREDIDGQS